MSTRPRTPIRYCILILVMILVGSALAGCGGDDSADAATTTKAPTTTTAAPTPTTTGAPTSPSLAGGRIPVAGTGNCNCDFGSAVDEGDTQVLTGTCVCINHYSDPRVSGREELPMTLSMFPGSDPEVHWFEYSGATLTSEQGGSWRSGEGFGSEFFDINGDLKTTGHTRYVGEGAYEGLVFEYFYAQSSDFAPDGDPHESYRMSGWIGPADAGTNY